MAQRPEPKAMARELDELRARVDGLTTANREARPVTRRRLLSGLAGLGAVGAAGVAAAEPAAAADGDPLVLGQQNDATSTTVISSVVDGFESELRFGESFFGLAATSSHTAIHGEVSGEGFAGVWGRSSGSSIGVTGDAQGPGGIGVAGHSVAGPAIAAKSDDGVTLHLYAAERVGPPTAMPAGLDDYLLGSISVDQGGELWLCVAGGSPGTWTRLLREDTAHGRVIPITPVRALDTRSTGGRASGAPAVPGQRQGPLRGSEEVTLDLAGAGPIPATATGIIGNATVLAPNADGYLRILPAGASVPACSFNFSKGTDEANGFTTGLAPTGITLVAPVGSSLRYHLVVDVAAYIS